MWNTVLENWTDNSTRPQELVKLARKVRVYIRSVLCKLGNVFFLIVEEIAPIEVEMQHTC